MNLDDQLSDLLKASLEEAAAPRSPDYLDGVLDRTARARQRPAWTFLQMWFPALPTGQPLLSQMMRLALLMLLLITLLGTAAMVGQRLLERRLPPPYGPASNGLLAFETEGVIFIASERGSDVRAVEAGLAISRQPTWSPDGQKLAFWSAKDRWSAWSLVIVDSAGRGGVVADGLNPRDPNTIALDEPIAWSPDSLQLAVRGARRQLNVLNADGSRFRVLGQEDGLWRSSPAWSPDGNWIAFKGIPMSRAATDRVGPGPGLFVIRPDGTDERRLPTSPGSEFAFQHSEWSPDSTKIAYQFGHPLQDTGEPTDLGYGVAVLDLEQDRETVLHDDMGHEYFPKFAPSGEFVAYQERAYPPINTQTIVLVEPDGTPIRRLDMSFIASPFMCLSPDGRYLLAEVERSVLRSSLELVALDGSERIDLGTVGAASRSCWQRLPQ
jgi:Tol biopolymer transport system component